MKNFACLKKILVFLALGCPALFAQTTTYTFYFLPPDSERWIAGNSYLYNGDVDSTELMQIDTARCGWFKKEFRSQSAIPEKAMIYLGSQGMDKLDMDGTGANLGTAAWIPLRARFGTYSALYIYYADNSLTIATTAPGNLGEATADRCSYKMAAFIYDTDNSVNPSFNGAYRDPGTANNGIRRGIVKPDLDTLRVVGTDTLKRKPTFARTTVPYANWQDEASFNAAFIPKGIYKEKISNVPRCYDMPFGRAANGTWEFDSDKMRTPVDNNPGLVGGFYPYILDSAYTLTDPEADYASCPECRKEYTVNCFNNMSTTQLNNLAPVTYKGVTYRGVEAFDRTYFPDGATHHTYYGNTYGCTTPRPGYNNTTKSRANLSFCFESHGEFVYEKGQEFFFRGDDDIWIFINNRLVIDLGGIHMPAPGYVDLDSIKTPEPLVEGKTYPIDVFFCERMGTQSNVRVSTNMYITQKSTFYNNPEKIDNWMCANIKGGADCASLAGGGSGQTNLCGNDLIKKNEYTVDFYMTKRGGETISLSGREDDCEGNAITFTCFEKDGGGGIKVDSAVYSCGGRAQCRGNVAAIEKVNMPSGEWTVYARLMDKSGKPVDGTKPLVIDNIKSSTNARIVWGDLVGNKYYETLYDAYGKDATKKEQRIIAGKRTPIYIAGGSWDDPPDYTSFSYESDPELVSSVRYSLSGAVGLEITSDKLGKEKATFPRGLPASGIDTLWVKGDFYMGEKEFNINLEGVSNSEDTPDLKLIVYQPKLRFTTDSTFTTFVNSANPGTANGFTLWTSGDKTPPYVGKALDVYVVAWDSLRNELCDHCNFVLRETSTTNNDSINDIWKDAIIQSDAVRIENGKQIIDMRGRSAVDDTNFAEWRIYGPSEGSTFAQWNKLQFIDAPVPMPLGSYVYDRNGDGIGDSLIIKFTKPFTDKDGKIAKNLLPVLLEVTWEKGNTVYFHAGNYSVDDLKKKEYVYSNIYKESFFEENYEYWKDKLVGSDTIIIAEPTTAFSRNILTYGKGSLSSYTPFYDQGKCGKECGENAFTYREGGYEASVFDRIPPIVVKAVYNMDKKTKNCGSKDKPCRELLEVNLSEPVFADTSVVDDFLFQNPFSYCFEYSQHSKCSEGKSIDKSNIKWDNLKWKWELPKQYSDEDVAHSATYKPSNKSYPKMYYDGAANGDNIANLTYLAYKIGDDATRMPKATDWMKLRSDKVVFRDGEGNTANPREIGVLISGTNYYKKEQVKIAEIVANPDSAVLGGIFEGRGFQYIDRWISKAAKGYASDNLFKPGNTTEFLPVPKGVTSTDTIKKYYPGSVGTLFEVAVDIDKKVQDILTDCDGGCRIKGSSQTLTAANIAEGITMHASVYYHTNLGNYTAHRVPVEANCADKIFQKEVPLYTERGNNCWGNEFNFYLAWDLKTNKDRFVGAGAYVAITKFYWQIEYRDANGVDKTEKSKEDQFIEMFGVRRGILKE